MTSAVAPSAGITGHLGLAGCQAGGSRGWGVASLACRNALARRHPRMRPSTPSPLDSKPSSTRRGISGLGMSGLRLARGLQSSCPVEGQPAMDSRCERLRGASAAVVAPMRRVSPVGFPSTPQRWHRAPGVSAHIGRRLPSGPVGRPAWRGTSEVSAHIGSSLPWTSRQSRPSVSQLVIRPSAPTPGPSPLEGGAHIGLWPPWVTGTKGHLLPRVDRRLLFCESFICEQRGRMATVRSALPDEQEDQRPSHPGQRGGARFTQGGASLPQGGAL